jgi:hypothetical protein
MYRTPSSKFTFICNGLAQNTEVTVLLRTQKPEDVWWWTKLQLRT